MTSASIQTYRCPVGACLGGENFSCSEGHVGPVCGRCNETVNENGSFYSWSGTGCEECSDTGGSSTPAIIVLVCILPVVWFLIAWKPLTGCGGFDSHVGSCLEGGTKFDALFEIFTTAAGVVQSGVKAVMPYSKIVISYFQVVSTFIKTFKIPWPDGITSFLSSMNIFSFNFFQLPVTACMVSDWDYGTMLAVYTTAPILILLLLAIPSILAWFMARQGSEGSLERLEATVSACSWWALFLFFIVYPAVSVTVLRTFSCLDLGRSGNWLLSDMRVSCPEPGEFSYNYSVFGIFLYPIGVPVAMLGMLYFYQVPHMARQKNKAARLRSLVGIFRQEVEEGSEEGITGRELEKWWETLGGWKADPVEALGGKEGLKALLRHTWTDPTLVEGDMDAKTLFLNKVEEAKEEARINSGQAAEEEEEEEPDGLDDSSLDSLRRKVTRLAEKGFAPKGTLSWNGEFGEEESRAIRRAGFLFELYEVETWWFEIFEMIRKLVMTSVLVFVTVGGLGQILVGLIVNSSPPPKKKKHN